MQTPTTTIRAFGGTPATIASTMPGTPTHSNTTAGRSGASLGSMKLGGAACSADVATATSRQLAYGERAAGSTTTSAPIRVASARRAAEKSAATIGDAPRSLSAAITASPTGPQPITSG